MTSITDWLEALVNNKRVRASLLCACFIAGAVPLAVRAQTKNTFSVSFKDVPVREALQLIEAESGYKFAYSPSIIPAITAR